jgi:hypothetical protein
MANIPVPERGQPLDLTYIYQIANTVNQLAANSSYSSNKFTSIESPRANVGRQDVKITDARMVGGYYDLAQNISVNAGQTIPFTYNFPAADFKYPPIVTATPETISVTDSGTDVSVTITSVTTSRVEGVVRFGTSGTASIRINLIAIGIPS